MGIKHVRNFWVEVKMSDRDSVWASGPKGKDGRMWITLMMRSNGEPSVAAEISCYPDSDDPTKLLIDIDGDMFVEPACDEYGRVFLETER